jgi:hypothetical protein
VETGPFFYAGDGSIVSPDNVVLDCYRLAKFYHLDPDIFLAKPLSELRRNLRWTGRLQQEIAEAQQDAMRSS